MTKAVHEFAPVRACLFDMDGLLLDTEDIYTLCMNQILEKYGRPHVPWAIKAKIQGRPSPEANKIFCDWAGLPLSQCEYESECAALYQKWFPTAKLLPGVEELLVGLNMAVTRQAGSKQSKAVHMALATSSNTKSFHLKTQKLQDTFSVFTLAHRILGDDPRVAKGRGKPCPDIYLEALKAINQDLPEGEAPIRPDECLVFEDSVQGVEAGRRAGMRVVWCPHPMLVQEYRGQEKDILAGRLGHLRDGGSIKVGEHDDGWAEQLASLEEFSYEKYGLVIPCR